MKNIRFILFTLLLFGSQLLQGQIEATTMQYAEVNGEKLYVDVYRSNTSNTALQPVIIWMHGGGFSVGSRDNTPDVRFMNEVVNNGYVGVSISYRLLRKGTETGFGCNCPAEDKRTVFREAAKDLWKAIVFVNEHATDWQLDTSKIIVGGSSAGAEGVMNAIYLKDWVFQNKESDEYKATEQVNIAGVLSFAGAVVDDRYLTEQTAVPGLFYHGLQDNLVPYGSAPHHYCDANMPGYIWLDGSLPVHDKLNQLNVANLLVTYTEGKHEISGVPFNDLPLLFTWINRLFVEKEMIQAHIIKEKKAE